MNITRKDETNRVRLIVSNNISVDNVEGFRKIVRETVVNSPYPLIIDLIGVSYLCSAGIGVVAMAHRLLRGREQGLTLANCSEKVIRLFTVTRLDSVLNFIYDVDEDE